MDKILDKAIEFLYNNEDDMDEEKAEIRHYEKFCVKAKPIRQKTACRDKHN